MFYWSFKLISRVFARALKHKATGDHFNLPGHRLADMEVTIIERIFNEDPQFRKQREQIWIETFNTKYKGLNRKS